MSCLNVRSLRFTDNSVRGFMRWPGYLKTLSNQREFKHFDVHRRTNLRDPDPIFPLYSVDNKILSWHKRSTVLGFNSKSIYLPFSAGLTICFGQQLSLEKWATTNVDGYIIIRVIWCLFRLQVYLTTSSSIISRDRVNVSNVINDGAKNEVYKVQSIADPMKSDQCPLCHLYATDRRISGLLSW